MRKVKQISIVDYVANYFMAILAAVAFLMLLVINILCNTVIRYDIRSDLSMGLRHNARNIDYCADGSFVIGEDFLFYDEGRIYLILDKNGAVIEGEYPEGFTKFFPVRHGALRQAAVGKDEYYIIDRYESGRGIAIRCVVKKADVSSRYRLLQYFSFLAVPVILVIGMISRKILKRSIQAPVRQITENAEEIGREKDLSKRMEYGGRYQEFAVLAQANDRMLDRLEEVFETQKRFTSDVAHELRTPVTVLLAQCEYSEEHLGDGEDAREALEIIRRQAEKMNHIVTQMLNLSRLDQDRLKLNLEWIDIGEIVRSVCEEFTFGQKKEISFDIDIPSDAIVHADIGLMTILLKNLIDNAVKYSPEHSVVCIWWSREGAEGCLYIKDQGCGIRPEDTERIFRRFFRVDKTEDVEGFGLGLPLARQIARKHGGTITVESQVGEGSTFVLRLPGEKGRESQANGRGKAERMRPPREKGGGS